MNGAKASIICAAVAAAILLGLAALLYVARIPR